MEGNLRFDSEWRLPRPYEVYPCGQLRCHTKCVKGRKRPGCVADLLHESNAED